MSYNGVKYKRKPDIVKRETQDQDDELLALASIYDSDLFHVDSGKYTGYFFAHMELPKPFHIFGFDGIPGMKKGESAPEECQVDFLPPITLKFRLPPDYPSKSKPYFQLSCKWLNNKQLSDLCSHLDSLWNENKGEVILFSWTGFLTECLPFLGIENKLDLSWATKQIQRKKANGLQNPEILKGGVDARRQKDQTPVGIVNTSFRPSRNIHYKMKEWGDRRAITDAANLALLLPSLMEYNQNEMERKFLASVFACQVCLEQKCGADSLRFKPCDHVFCKDCMKTYFEVQIKEGNINHLTCPEGKCSTQAIPSQIRELVGSELFAKYDSMLLTSTLDAMSDIAYCPRMLCQCAILLEPESTMGTCPACFFVFCIYCRMAYHGVEPCRMKSEEFRRLYDSYVGGTSQQKAVLEARYGKMQLKRLVESTLSEGWMQENSKECPHCRAHIEKIDGCNKMTCWKCSKYFCWRCMAKLDSKEPYKHFDEPGAGCYAQLFAGLNALPDDQEDQEDEDFGDGFNGEFGQFLN